MKQIVFLSIAVLLFISIGDAQQQKLVRVSPYASVTQTVGITDMSISYYRPGVKGRDIWGALVPYNQVWRSGANNATSFTFSDDVTINGTVLKAGTYSFFTIPSEKEWTVIFNSDANQWGAYNYDSTKNVLRFGVTPAASTHEEWLSYSFTDVGVNSAVVTLRWEKLSVSFTISTDTYANISNYANGNANSAAAAAATFARYAMDTKTMWDEGMKAIDKAIGLNPSFGNYATKANLYAQKEMFAEAVAAGEMAVKIGKEQKANTASFEKSLGEWNTKLPKSGKKKK